jgi:hypothetical protein
MSRKDTHLIGQPVFKQLVNFIPRNKFNLLVHEKKSDRYYKNFSSWTQLVSMLFGIFSRCDSSVEVADGMHSLAGKLNHLGLQTSPAKSTFGDGLRNRNHEFFRDVYFMLIEHFKPFLSVSRLDKVSFEKLFIFDSSTIGLFSDVMKGVGRNAKNEGKKKGGLKVHMLIDAHSDTPTFVRISEGKCHDKHFIKYLSLPAHSMIVFDRAYNHYQQFAQFSQNNISFVCRKKKNAVYEVLRETYFKVLDVDQPGVLIEEQIRMTYTEQQQKKHLILRKVTYKDEKNKIYEFISNNFDISREEVAHIYKLRWNIELMFKKLKQNFQLHYFYSETENGIKTQIWCTLIAQLLLLVLKTQSKTEKAFSTVAALIRIYLISNLEIMWIIKNCRRTYIKLGITKNKSPGIQTEMF